MNKNLLSFLATVLISGLSYGQYCTTGLYSSGCIFDDDLGNFTLNTINNTTSGCPANNYADFTSISTTLLPMTAYNWSALTNYGCCEHFAFWVDYNNDGDFNDAGELIYSSSVTAGTWSGVYNTPNVAGTFRLRARVKWAGSPMTATDACTSFSYGETEDYTITILPPALTALVPDTINLLCNGDMLDSLEVNVAGGDAPYTYSWSTSSTDSVIYNLTAGSYTVTVGDANGDFDTAYIEIVEPAAISTTTTELMGITCNDQLASGEVVATGGTPSPSNYIVDTSGVFQFDNSQTGTLVPLGDEQVSAALPIGFSFTFFGNTYTNFYISSNGFVSFQNDGSGCCTGQTLPSPTIPNNLIALAWEDLNPNSGGTISYYTTGTAPNQMLVVEFDSIAHYGNAAARIKIQLKLFEGTNCIEIHTDYMQPDASTNQTQGIENASGTMAFWYPGRNGDPTWEGDEDMVRFCPDPYSSYLWSSGEASPIATQLVAGMNYVTVTDGNGCEAVDSLLIVPASDLQTDLILEDISCYGFDDGYIDPQIFGGAQPYDYQWNNNETTATISDLVEGVYSLTVEDALGCVLVVSDLEVIEPDILLGSIYGVTNAICENDTNGIASIVVTGGRPPYSPVWSNGTIGYTANNLSSGGHNVQVTDSSGCFLYVPVNIGFDNPSPQPELGSNVTSTTGATVTLSTAPQNFTSYLWKGGSNGSTLDVTETGNYWVEVTNAFGCTGSDSIYVEVWPTGIKNIEDIKGVRMFPNPATDLINFELSEDVDNLQLNIIDGRGAVVGSFNLNGQGIHTADISMLAAGVYSMNMTMNGKTTAMQMLVVQ